MPNEGDVRTVRRGNNPEYAFSEQEIYHNGVWLPARFFKSKKKPQRK